MPVSFFLLFLPSYVCTNFCRVSFSDVACHQAAWGISRQSIRRWREFLDQSMPSLRVVATGNPIKRESLKTHLVQVTWSQRDLVRMERTSTQKSYVLKSDQRKLLEKSASGSRGWQHQRVCRLSIDWLIDWFFHIGLLIDGWMDGLIDWLSLCINDHPVSLPGKPPRIPAMDPSKQFWPNSNRRKVTRRRKQSKFTVRWGRLRPMIWLHRRDTANFTLTVGWSTRARQMFVRLFFLNSENCLSGEFGAFHLAPSVDSTHVLYVAEKYHPKSDSFFNVLANQFPDDPELQNKSIVRFDCFLSGFWPVYNILLKEI